jgi:septal ring-binding cell division protein DamX
MRQNFSEYHDPDDRFGPVGEDRADEFSRADRRLPTIFLSALAMALFAGGLWFAYVQGTRHAAVTASGDSVPLIRADERPAKVRPDQPGGMTIPDQNVSLYDEKPGGAPVEKLLPAAEQPMPRPAPAKEAAAPAPPAASATQSPATQPTAKPAAKAAPKPTVAAPAKPAAPAAVPGGKVQIQLGSVRSPEAARDDWARLKRENTDLLGNLTAVAVRTDLGDKGIYYRVLAGSFGDAAAAEKLCGELKRRNLGCILAR